MSFWDVVSFIFISFMFVALLLVMFSIITDLFRDRDLSGGAKAAWVVALVLVPFLASLVYLVARGRGMGERAAASAEALRRQQDAYIREVAGKVTPADQISQARAMLDAGVISEPEYSRLKEKALV